MVLEPWWKDGLDGLPGGMRFRAPYDANNNIFLLPTYQFCFVSHPDFSRLLYQVFKFPPTWRRIFFLFACQFSFGELSPFLLVSCTNIFLFACQISFGCHKKVGIQKR